jgi:subtilisin family serine protease
VAVCAAASFLAPAARAVALSQPNDPLYPAQWALQSIGAAAAWPTADGHGVTIAIVDTGVDLRHPDLQAKLVAGFDLLAPGQPPQDDNGHGTHLAGIAAATTGNGVGIAGVSPAARIMPVKVLDSHGEGDVTTVAAGVRWAADHGADVINLALGDLVPGQVSPQLDAAARYAWDRGAICVIAAGNTPNVASGFVDRDAMVVGAVGRDNAPVGYSSQVGSAAWGISAPGGMDDGRPQDDILSAYWVPNHKAAYAYLAGSSMATAFVAGALADLLSSGLTPTRAATALVDTADPLGDHGRFGAGVLDLARAVGFVGAQASPSAPAVTVGPGTGASGLPHGTAPGSTTVSPADPSGNTTAPGAPSPPTTSALVGLVPVPSASPVVVFTPPNHQLGLIIPATAIVLLSAVSIALVVIAASNRRDRRRTPPVTT